MQTQAKLAALRELMKQEGLQAYVVTNADPHLSEYMAAHYKYRAWLSGFTGSAGTVVVTEEMAGLWTDGRYYIQAENELTGSGIDLFRAAQPGTPSIPEFLAQNLPQGAHLGFDGTALSAALYQQFKKQLKQKEIVLHPDKPLIAKLWQENRPALPDSPVFQLDLKYAGQTPKQKLEQLRLSMATLGLDNYICGSLEAGAWLSNLRSWGIIDFNATFPCYVMLDSDQAQFFVETKRLTPSIQAELQEMGLEVREYTEINDYIKKIPAGKEVGLDSRSINALLYSLIPATVQIIEVEELIAALKTVKNEAEIEALKQGHILDGIAYLRFLMWFEQQDLSQICEYDVSQKLTALRLAQPGCYGDAFRGIIAYGANAAMMHYGPDPEYSSRLSDSGFLLMDSGGMYPGCTTDITRTIACGELTDEEKFQFTLTLQSVIGLASATFLEGSSGLALDILSRGLMWQHGLDYKCGTGHGVGAGLSVHEGPQSFSSPVKLKPNMVLTIEPGIYLEGLRGIRLENQVYVTMDRYEEVAGQFFAFSSFTMAPIDKKAIVVEQLSAEELAWLNAYHATVYQTLAPHLNIEEKAFLEKACQPLGV